MPPILSKVLDHFCPIHPKNFPCHSKIDPIIPIKEKIIVHMTTLNKNQNEKKLIYDLRTKVWLESLWN